MRETELGSGDDGDPVADEEFSSPVLRREPSFSRWCDPIPSPDGSPRGGSAEEPEEDFQLPLLPLDVERGTNLVESRDEDKESLSKGSVSAVTVIKTMLLILVWYSLSTCLTLYNKSLLGEHLGHFPAPLLMNAIHFTLQAILSNTIVFLQSRDPESKTLMNWRDYFVRVVPTALGTALDVNLSNASLMFISVTFATMCKSASPIFLLMFAFAFKLETPNWRLLGIIVIMSIGVLLTVAKETEFQLWGFIFVMLASVMAGFRWSMTQILLQKEAYGLRNPLTLMSYVSPIMAVSTMILSLLIDPWHKFKKNNYFDDPRDIFLSSLLMLLGGALAFFMVLTEYVLVSVTSAVTVTVAGIFKEAITILVAVVYFHDQFTLFKGLGLLVIMFGVSLFNWYKYQRLTEHRSTEKDESLTFTSKGAVKYVSLEKMVSEDDS